MWNGRPRPFGGCGLSLLASSLCWWPAENAGREYTMKRAKLKDNTEEREAHTGKAAQALWAKPRKAQNG